jgi:acetoin:2,6-dichlorophenolindophenol oxidoreductase subunit alpha
MAEVSNDRLIGFYRTMRLIRRFEQRVVKLVIRNEIPGVTHEYVGEEAVGGSWMPAARGRVMQTDVSVSYGQGKGAQRWLD